MGEGDGAVEEGRGGACACARGVVRVVDVLG